MRGKTGLSWVPIALAGLLSAAACEDDLASQPPPAGDPPAQGGAGGAAPPPTDPGLTPSPVPPPTGATLPPPISGGTLLVLRDGRTAVASDPDRDRIYVVDLIGQNVRATVELAPGAEPGRAVEDAASRVHVALRGAGDLLSLDPADGKVLARRALCPAPRGLAFDPAQRSAAPGLRRRRAGLHRTDGPGRLENPAAGPRPARRHRARRPAAGQHLSHRRSAAGRRRRAGEAAAPARGPRRLPELREGRVSPPAARSPAISRAWPRRRWPGGWFPLPAGRRWCCTSAGSTIRWAPSRTPTPAARPAPAWWRRPCRRSVTAKRPDHALGRRPRKRGGAGRHGGGARRCSRWRWLRPATPAPSSS